MLDRTFIITLLTVGKSDPINVTNVVTFLRQEDSAAIAKRNGRFKIEFMHSIDGPNPRVTVWRYEKEEDRDCDFDKIVSVYATELSSISKS